jgi:lipopolysaccharide export system protein LptC
MFNDKNFYSQFVGFLKVTLPLAALILMSTVFLVARAPSPETTIPYAEIQEIAREPGLSGAQFSGVADDGSVISLTARNTRPVGDIITADTLLAGIDTVDGTRIDISAGTGEINNSAQTARLTGLARMVTSNGYEMETAGFIANFSTGRIVSEGALEVQAPFGALTAGNLVIETPEGTDEQVMLFQNGVRLVYTPQQ